VHDDPAASVHRWQCCRLPALEPLALLRIMRARQEVFVVEQQCIYLDADEADASSAHLVGWSADERVLAYARLVDPGVKYAEASIGRVITTAPARGTGLGRVLVARAIDETRRRHPGTGIRISAQSRLEAFYAGFGFRIVGERYLEDGIPHTEMLLPA
jgi:ElaA protein